MRLRSQDLRFASKSTCYEILTSCGVRNWPICCGIGLPVTAIAAYSPPFFCSLCGVICPKVGGNLPCFRDFPTGTLYARIRHDQRNYIEMEKSPS